MNKIAQPLTDLSHIKETRLAQKTFFSSGTTKDIKFRIETLKALRTEIENRTEEICKALHADLGKSKTEAYITEVGIVLSELNKMIKKTPAWARPRKVATPMFVLPAKSRIEPEPYGTTLIISPWNYPFQLLFNPIIGAVAAGNTVVCKPSEFVPQTTAISKEIIEKIFDPRHVSCVLGGIPESTALLAERWDYVFFTGSPKVGKIVYKAAAEHLTPVTLELGGKSPCIIDKTANLDTTASRIIFGKYINCGQTCIAPDYLFVHEDIKDKLIEKLKAKVKDFYGTDPQKSEDYGRIVNERHFDRVVHLIDESKVVFGGETDRVDKYIAPTFIDGVTKDDVIMQEEIFGPLLPILTWNNLEEVKNFINDYEKPLVLYYFSKNKSNVEYILTHCSSGDACINDCLVQNANDNLPFGGVGESGIGSYHGKFSFDTFSHMKGVVYKASGMDLPIRYAPWGKNYGKLKFLVDKTL